MRIKILSLIYCLALTVEGATATQPPNETGDEWAVHNKADTPPQPVDRPSPQYPFEMVRAGLGGAVELRFVIGTDGKVRDVRLGHTNNPWFVRPAIDAVRRWKFRPARKDGVPVEFRTKQLIQFSMEGEEAGNDAWTVRKRSDQADLPPQMQWETPPKPLWTTFPIYPLEALRAKQKGVTQVSFLVGPNGRVVEAKLVEATTPEMGQAVLAMIDAWRFIPAKNKQGAPCFAMLSIRHEFLLNGRSDAPVPESAWDILAKQAEHPEKIVPIKELDSMPKLQWHENPVYPSKLLKDGRTGEAVVEFYVDAEGDAQLPRIVSATEEEFGYAAEQAIITWHFDPPLKNGKPVITKARIPIKFQHP